MKILTALIAPRINLPVKNLFKSFFSDIAFFYFKAKTHQ